MKGALPALNECTAGIALYVGFEYSLIGVFSVGLLYMALKRDNFYFLWLI